ncbi:MAG: DEAD/DEAH box helicase family protein, partial [Thermoguttaceae bacterium]|nr:DEAD/DEAH box helicase family protein [Thermoguttaceae bacterium]
EFYIPRLSRERGVIGTEFEIRLRNELTQKAIARECADWIKRKAVFRSLSRQASTNEILHVQTNDYSLAYQPFHEFSTVGLGCRPGDEGSVLVTRLGAPHAEKFLSAFNKLWDDRNLAQDVTEQVIENITAVYQENSAELIYVLTLYHVFKDFLDDTDEDSLPNERVGFCQTRIWEKLYDFQRDAVLGIIHKLERYNGCILADSVGLGKTFTALAVIKYYELRNKNVLVLCPKKLQLNWSTFRQNVIHNPIQADRLRYDVLFHTDLSRTTGKSALGLPLDRLNWGNYDLVVIDESHNFRNGGDRIDPDRYRINRYNTLMEKVIRSGVQTKVLMLTATPVNNRFNDLRNQLALAYEGESEKLDHQLSLSSDVNTVFRQAQQAYNEWVRLPLEDRTTEALLKRLDMDFFTLLDSVTIARSRRHIRRYYDMTKIGSFPKRLPPISVRPKITDLPGVVNYSEIYDLIDQLKLSGYTPTKFIQPSKRAKYELTGRTTSNLSTEGREEGLRRIMAINLLKRLESSIHSFRTTLQRVRETFRGRIEAVSAFEKARRDTVVDASDLTSIDSQLDSDDQNTELFTVSERYKVSLADMDYISWRREMVEDCGILEDILTKIEKITPRSDTKLKTLLSMIDKKVSHPTGSGNKKVLIFTAFADTAEYLYDQICVTAKKNHLHCGLVTGTKNQS